MPTPSRSLSLVLVLLGAAGCASPAGPPEQAVDPPATVLYFVRHAEKAAVPADDPPLTAAGEARALALADTLAGVGLRAIYSSQYARTRATAAPLAARAGLDVTVLPIAGPDVDATLRAQVRQIAAETFSHRALVVGHSNTIPTMIAELTGEPMADLEDTDYGTLFVVTLDGHPDDLAASDVALDRRRVGGPDPE